MNAIFGASAVAAALLATNAAAQQPIDLSGQYVCIQSCASEVSRQRAFVTQNGWNMNLINEAGIPSRAWVDWPGHIWIDSYQEGAIYSRDGMFIQFDHGAIWRRSRHD
jgi:hypothetical protein